MTLNTYQKRAYTTALLPSRNLNYMALGMCSESGEFAGVAKRRLRGDGFDKENAIKELGDVLWYVSGAAKVLGVSLEEVAQKNLSKLSSRKKRGKIIGKGDAR